MGENQHMTEDLQQLIDNTVRDAILNNKELQLMADRLADQSYALREIAHLLAEYGIPVTRFTRRTTEVLVAVALNGNY